MNRAVTAGIAAAGLALGVTACHSSHHPASSLTKNPAVQKDVKAEEALITKCLTHGKFATKSERKAAATCASGGQSVSKFEACATRQLKATSLVTKRGRHAWVAAVASKCVVPK